MKKMLTLLALTVCALSPVYSYGQTNDCGSCPTITNSFFYGTIGDSLGSSNFDIPANPHLNAQHPVTLNVVSDPSGGWNSTSDYWAVPVSGTYQIVIKLRLADRSEVGAQCEINAGTSPGDSPNGLYFTVPSGVSGYDRAAACDTIVEHFNAGDHITMYDGPDDNGGDLGGDNASMTINLLFTDQ